MSEPNLNKAIEKILIDGGAKPLSKKKVEKLNRALERLQKKSHLKPPGLSGGFRPLYCPCHHQPVSRTKGGLISYTCRITGKSVDPFGPRLG